MKIAALFVPAVLACVAAPAVHAQSGTITFNGHVTSVTCDVSFNGTAGPDATIVLPRVSTTSLTAGTSAGRTPITLRVGGAGAQCNSGSVALELNPSRNAQVTASGRLRNLAANGADNVAIALRDADDRLIDISTPWTSKRVDLDAGGAEIEFSGEYYADGADAGAGAVTTNVQYTLNYN